MITEPLFIYGPKHELLWENPDINQLCDFAEDEEHSDTPVHRVWLYTNVSQRKMALTIICKSPVLDRFWEDCYDKEKSEILKINANPTVKQLRMELEVALLEDVWMPGGEQFCFTKIGEKIGQLFKKTAKYTEFSPDCAVSKYTNADGTVEYGYDT